MNLGEARAIVGAAYAGFPFGKTSKMPGYSYGLDAFQCQRGSRLAEDPKSPCHGCYARRNYYATWGPVIRNREAHQVAVHHELWADAMIILLDHYIKPLGERYFRMHDSGDLVDVQHLRDIAKIAAATPWLKYWLPTHEPYYVASFLDQGGIIPSNLVVRLSADYNDRRPRWKRKLDLPTSTTHTVIGKPVQVSDTRKDSIECLSYKRNHQCGSCRACWSADVKNVSYPLSGGASRVSRAQRSTMLRVVA